MSFAARSVAVTALLAGALATGYTIVDRPDRCEGEFDAARWKAIASEDDDDNEGERRALADDLVDCGRLVGRTKDEVARLAGRPVRDRRSGPRNRESWFYRLGPDGLQLDEDVLVVQFNAAGRVDSVIAATT